MIISTTDLNSLIHQEDDLLIIDTRSFKEYSDGHISGAVNLDLFAFHWIDTTPDGIKNFNKQAETIFSFIGVTNKKKVVFYDQMSGMLAARGVWMLLYLSHPDVVLLDGGMGKWQKEKLLVELKQNKPNPSKFIGKPNPELIAGFSYIQENLDTLNIIDARSIGEFNGQILRAAQEGHIRGAKNIDWNLNLTDEGIFKDESELSKLYDFSKDSEIVTYCQGAYRAANSFLVLKKLGFKNVRVYLGSWGEWGNTLELPTEK